MLNAVKCTIASVFFLVLVPFRTDVWREGLGLDANTTAASNSTIPDAQPDVPEANISMLVLSALLGITIGDIVWLQVLYIPVFAPIYVHTSGGMNL